MSIDKFKFYCQKVLPLVYDDSLSYYEVLCKTVNKLNEIINSQNELTLVNEEFRTNLYKEWKALEGEFKDDLEGAVATVFNTWKDEGVWDEILNGELLGEINTSISSLQTKDVELENSISTLSANTSESIATLQTSIATTNTNVSKNTSDISSLSNTVSSNYSTLDDKIDAITDAELTELVFIGDSFGTGYNSEGDSYIESKRIPTRLAAQLHLNLHNYAVNAAGYTITDNTFLSQANAAIADTSFNHSKVKYIVIFGGINDVNNHDSSLSYASLRTAVANAAHTVIYTLANHFTNVDIIIMPNWGAVSFTTFDSWVVFNSLAYFGLATTSRNIRVITDSAMALVGYTNLVQSDNIHPNELGSMVYANCLASLINGSRFKWTALGYKTDYYVPSSTTGWNNSQLTIYKNGYDFCVMGYTKANTTITASNLSNYPIAVDIPRPFTFPVEQIVTGIRSDTGEAVGILITPPLTLSDSNYTEGKITLVGLTSSLAVSTTISISAVIPGKPF